MIWKLIRRNIAGKPFRFLLTCSAVTAGVMFTVGIFVFTDGLRATFDELAANIEGNVDLAVRTEVEFGDQFNRPPIDPALTEIIEEVPGVVAVQPRILKFDVFPVDGDDNLQEATSAPNIGLNWEGETPTPRLFLNQGRAPEGPNEFVLDADAFEDGTFELGGNYEILTPFPNSANTNPDGDYTLVGTFFFASEFENLLVGAKLLAFDTATSLEVLNGNTGFDEITAVADQTFDEAAVIADIQAAIPSGYEVITGEQLQQEQEDNFNDFINIFQTVLLVFAFIILIVSAFVIFNVFTILIGQRIRELGLLRAVGATGRQISTALLGEALMVGVFATVVGTTLGIGFGWTLRWLLQQFDFGPSGNELLLQPATFIAGAAVGILVTLASAVAPALRARRLSPMAALREDARLTRHEPDINLPLGIGFTAIAWVLIGLPLTGDGWEGIIPLGILGAFANAFGVRRIHPVAGRFATLALGLVLLVLSLVLDLGTAAILSLLAVAAVTLFVGVNAISPALARPVSHFLGRWPLAILLGIGGVITTLLGVGALGGSIYLVILSLVDVITDFDLAGVLGFVGSFIPLAIAAGILLVGIRAVDAAFIMGWSARQVVVGFVIFLVGAAGVVSILVGLASILTADWESVPVLFVGALLFGAAYWAKRFVPSAMKSNARMARENAGRSPRRTASAAAALMIGLALVSTATVVASSFKATFASILEESVTSDWFISPRAQQNPNSGFSTELADGLEQLEVVDTVVRFRFVFEAYITQYDGNVTDSSATNLALSLDHLDPDFVALDESLLGRDAIWIHEDVANDQGFDIGSQFAIEFNDGVTEAVTVAGIFTDSSIYGNRVVDLSLWEDHFVDGQDQFVSVTVVDGETTDSTRDAIEAATAEYRQVYVDTRDEFQDRQEAQIDQVLVTFNVLLLVSIVIALLGIAITLALSVIERTRELGLVRAVGMTSQQMLRMVLFEGAIIAVFGGVLGVVLGTVFGSAAVVVIPDTFIRTLDIPVPALLQYLAIASVAGIAAAIVPARRAARLNVLDAISQG